MEDKVEMIKATCKTNAMMTKTYLGIVVFTLAVNCGVVFLWPNTSGITVLMPTLFVFIMGIPLLLTVLNQKRIGDLLEELVLEKKEKNSEQEPDPAG